MKLFKCFTLIVMAALGAGCVTKTQLGGQSYFITSSSVPSSGELQNDFNKYSVTQAYLKAIINNQAAAISDQRISPVAGMAGALAAIELIDGSINLMNGTMLMLPSILNAEQLNFLLSNEYPIYSGGDTARKYVFGIVHKDKKEDGFAIYQKLHSKLGGFCVQPHPKYTSITFRNRDTDVSNMSGVCNSQPVQLSMSYIDDKRTLGADRVGDVFFQLSIEATEAERIYSKLKAYKGYGLAQAIVVDGKKMVKVSYEGKDYLFDAPTRPTYRSL